MKALLAWLSAAFVLPLAPGWAWQPDGWAHTSQSAAGDLYTYAWDEQSWYYFDPSGLTWVYNYDRERWLHLRNSDAGNAWSYWYWPHVWADGHWYYCQSAGVQWVYDYETGEWGGLGEVLPKQILPAVADYYPRSGPAGSTVYVLFEEPVVGPARKIRAYYAGVETLVSHTGETVIAISVPPHATAGDIILVSGRSESAAVPFTVMEKTVSPLLTEAIGPSNDTRTFRAGDEISVTVPAGMVTGSGVLSVARVAHAPANAINPFGPFFTYEISVGDMQSLGEFLEIGIRYDPQLLDPDQPAEAQLIALRWDETLADWVALPQRVDADEHYIYAYTDHLSLFGILVVGGVSMVASWVGEAVLNDVYVTPLGNFRILYSKKAMDDDPLFTDYWSGNRPHFNVSHATEYPAYIQDIGHVFEVALANFRAAGFKSPQTAGLTDMVLASREWKNPITVKIESYWSKIVGIGTSDPQYEKIWQNIHLPTVELQDYHTSKSSYAVIGHELFHRLQAEYYGRSGFLRKSNYWWIEATAEYAGSRAAWAEKLDYLHRDIGANFLTYSISTTGPKWGEKLYEYAASVFVQFLVEVKGLDFQEMVAVVASGQPIARLSEHIASKDIFYLKDYYAQFAAWTVFSQNSFLKNFKIADFSSPDTGRNEIAEKKDLLELAKGDTLSVEASGGGTVFVDAFIMKEGERVGANTFPNPLDRLAGGQSWSYGAAKDGDVLYFLAVNHDDSDRSMTLRVRVDKDEGPEASHTFDLRRGYSARLWAVQIHGEAVLTITPDEITATKAEEDHAFTFKAEKIPAKVERVYFEWDFGDGQADSKDKSTAIAVVSGGPSRQGKAEHDVTHAFAPGKSSYTLTVVMKEMDTERELARATARITLHRVLIEGGVGHFVYELPLGVTELEHVFEATATPPDTYRFEWIFGDGKSVTQNKGPGENSIVANTYSGLKDGDVFHPKVRLRDVGGDVLAEDAISIRIIGEVWEEGTPRLTAVEPMTYSSTGAIEVHEAAPIGSLIRISGENLPTFLDFWYDRGRIEVGGVPANYSWLEIGERTPDGDYPVLWLTARVPEFNALYGDVVVHLNDKGSNAIAVKTSLGKASGGWPLRWTVLGKTVTSGSIDPKYLTSYHDPLVIEWFRDGVRVETGTYFSNRDEAASKPGENVYYDYTLINVVVTDALGRQYKASSN